MSEAGRPAATTERVLAVAFEVLAVAMVLFLAVFHHLYWAWRAPVVSFGDTAAHLHLSACMDQVVSAPLPWHTRLMAAWAWRGMYPPLVYLTTVAWSAMDGVGLESAVASLAPYVALLVLSAYFLGRLAGGPVAGLVAACLVMVEPVLLTTQLAYFIDIPVAAFTMLGVTLLVASRDFERPVPTVALGVAAGLGFLAKFSVLFFLAVPLGYVAVRALYRQARKDGEAVSRFAVMLLVPTVVFTALLVPLVRNARQMFAPALVPDEAAMGMQVWIVVCCACWVLSRRFLRGPSASIYRAVCAFALLAGPWVLSNAVVLLMRSGELRRHGLSELQACLGDLGSQLPSYLLIALELAVAAFLLSAPLRRALVPAYLALIGGGVITFIMQPSYSLHYMVPLTVLTAAIAGASVPRVPLISVPVACVALALATLVMLRGPARDVYPTRLDDLTTLTRELKLPLMGPRDPSRPFDEKFATALLATVPTDVASIAVVDGWNTFPNQALFSLATAGAWNGRMTQVWMSAVDLRNPTSAAGNVIYPDIWSATRLQGLARLEGVSPDRLKPPAADAVVLCRTDLSAAQVATLFRGEYRQVSWGSDLARLFLRARKEAK